MAHHLAQWALAAAGVEEKSTVDVCLRRLDHLLERFVGQTGPEIDPLRTAKALFHWLWKGNPQRYKAGGEFKLHGVIDAQISGKAGPVGNCLGLTLLFNCLCHGLGIGARAVHVEHAFENGPHVLTLLDGGGPFLDVENILPEGFDYQGHLDDASRTVWGSPELVADVCLAMGNRSFQEGRYAEASQHYARALLWNPRYEAARLNWVIVGELAG